MGAGGLKAAGGEKSSPAGFFYFKKGNFLWKNVLKNRWISDIILKNLNGYQCHCQRL